MLLLNSCFIIYVIISISTEMYESLISLDWNIKEIRSDLLLLENQIPLLVLRNVYSIIQKETSGSGRNLPDLSQVLGQFIYMDIPWRFHDKLPCEEANYLLELYWKCFLPKLNEISLVQESPSSVPNSSEANFVEFAVASGATKNIPSATELYRVAGVKIISRPLEDWDDWLNRSCAYKLVNEVCSHTLMYVKPLAAAFSCCVPFLCYLENNHKFFVTFRDGIIQMPSLKIDRSTKIILTNLIGYEKCISFEKRKVSSYMLLMDSLINTEEDVELLQRRGVIINTLSTTSEATIFFNDIGNLCTVDNQKHLFADLFKDVNEYYNKKWNRRVAKLRHNYFNSPWAVISVFAGGFLLILAGLQTFYTIYPYYHPQSHH